jgi:hypothetical protein
VDTLVRQSPTDAPADAGTNGAQPPETPGGPPALAETPTRTCKACGAAMSAEQDWCLECGTARPGRLGTRAGWRAAATVSGATLLLVCGAVAASYAALTDDAGKKADEPGGGAATPIAQQPVQVPGAPVTSGPGTTTPGVGTALGTPTTPGGSTQLPSLPTLPNNNSSSSSSSGTTLPNNNTSTGTTTTGTTTTSTTNTTTTNTTTTPATTTLTPITLGADAADLYDPYQRSTGRGDPADAYDKNAGNSWFVTTPSDGKPMQVGLLVDLESRKTLKQIEFATTTPGFRLEVYGTDGSALPPDILDTRWTHLASRSDVDQNTTGDNKKGDDKEIVKLAKDGEQVRQLVLWFTTPADAGATVRLRDLVLKG